MGILFGPAGNSDSFYTQYKHTYEAPQWLSALGLSSFEYSLGHGISIKEQGARKIGEQARTHNIAMSVHAPYYINLANIHSKDANLEYFMRSSQVVQWMGGNRMVFHPGYAGNSKEESLAIACETLSYIIEETLKAYPNQIFCPETMGRLGELGTVDDVIQLCKLHEQIYPAVDFGHINARTQGRLNTREDYAAILDAVENGLGQERLMHMHIHFTHIEYGPRGEKKHLTNADAIYGPYFEPLAHEIARRKMEPVIISESRGTQSEDALEMRHIHDTIKGELLC